MARQCWTMRGHRRWNRHLAMPDGSGVDAPARGGRHSAAGYRRRDPSRQGAHGIPRMAAPRRKPDRRGGCDLVSMAAENGHGDGPTTSRPGSITGRTRCSRVSRVGERQGQKGNSTGEMTQQARHIIMTSENGAGGAPLARAAPRGQRSRKAGPGQLGPTAAIGRVAVGDRLSARSHRADRALTIALRPVLQ